MPTKYTFTEWLKRKYPTRQHGWRGCAIHVIWHRTGNREVEGSTLDRTAMRNDLGQVVHTLLCLCKNTVGWWSGVVVSAMASINGVNLRQAQLVLRWTTVSGFNSRCRTLISVCNHPPTQGQLNLPSLRVGKWVPASAGKAKAGMVHSVSGWTRDVQVKLWNPLRTRVIPERLRGVFTTRRYTNPRLPLPLPLPLPCR